VPTQISFDPRTLTGQWTSRPTYQHRTNANVAKFEQNNSWTVHYNAVMEDRALKSRVWGISNCNARLKQWSEFSRQSWRDRKLHFCTRRKQSTSFCTITESLTVITLTLPRNITYVNMQSGILILLKFATVLARDMDNFEERIWYNSHLVIPETCDVTSLYLFWFSPVFQSDLWLNYS
jgi:hypothetical protein